MYIKNIFLSLSFLTLSHMVIAQTTDLSVVKTTNLTRVIAGTNLTYTLTAHNSGPDDNNNVIVTDFLPDEVTIVNMDQSCVVSSLNSQQIDCQFALPNGATKSIDIEVHVNGIPSEGPRIYMSGHDTNFLKGFYRFSTDKTFVETLGASMNEFPSPTGVYLQNDGGFLMAQEGVVDTVVNGAPVIDGEIHYMHPLEVLGVTIASGGLLVNPDDMILAPDGMIYVADRNGIRLDGMGQPTANRKGRIIKINPATGVQSIVSENGLLDTPTGLVWHNNALIVIDKSLVLISINPTTGTQTQIATGGLMQTPESIVFAVGNYYIADATVGIIIIEPGSGHQSILIQNSIGFLSNPIDLDDFDNQELFVLEGSSSKIWRIDIGSGGILQTHSFNSDMNEIFGIDVDTGESYLINHSNIYSNNNAVDPNFLNDASSIATPVDITNVIVDIDVTESINLIDTVNTTILIPPIISGIKPISGRCHIQLLSGDVLPSTVTELEVKFSTSMLNPSGDSSLIDVTNPNNYRLFSSTGIDEVFPNNCSDVIGGNIVNHEIQVKSYDDVSNTVILGSTLSTGLPKAVFKLMACYDGLSSTQGLFLDGDSNGISDDDFIVDFNIGHDNYLTNANFNEGLMAWQIVGDVQHSIQDADEAIVSGSASLAESSRVEQCVEISGSEVMRFGATLWTNLEAQHGEIHITHYDTLNCQGNVLSTERFNKDLVTNNWDDFAIDFNVSSSTLSVLVGIENTNSSNHILLDRTYLDPNPQLIYTNGFEENNLGLCEF